MPTQVKVLQEVIGLVAFAFEDFWWGHQCSSPFAVSFFVIPGSHRGFGFWLSTCHVDLFALMRLHFFQFGHVWWVVRYGVTGLESELDVCQVGSKVRDRFFGVVRVLKSYYVF